MKLATSISRPARLLVATNLTKVFGQTVALWRVSLSARSGDVLAVAGGNGSGKSTLLRVLAGLTPPTAGSVSWAADAAAAPPRLAYVGHATHLLDGLTPLENVRLAARLARGGAEPVEILDELGVSAHGGRPCGELSAGTQRRVAIARALATDPDVLLLDEPFAGLDADSAARTESVLGEHAERGGLIVMASHDLARSERLATRQLVLAAGRLAPPRASQLTSAAP